MITQPKDIWQGNNNAPLLLQSLQPSSGNDFEIRTRIVMTPTANYHQGGLVIYGDDDNYVRFTYAYIDGPKFEFAKEIGGNFQPIQVPAPPGINDFHLRIAKLGTNYYGYYSQDGANWTLIGTNENVNISPVEVGLLAFNAMNVTAIEIPADFDYFQVVTTGFTVVDEARLDNGMLYPQKPFYRDCPSALHPTDAGNYTGCGGRYHGFYKGVCTDVVMDGYNAGASFNIQNALLADLQANRKFYPHASARNTEDMRQYFQLNQLYFTKTLNVAYLPGDIAFFDWNGDGIADHVAIVSQLTSDGHPTWIVEAQYEGQPAVEDPWGAATGQYAKEPHVMGHGRLSAVTAAPLVAASTHGLQQLRVTVDSSLVKLRLTDANGKYRSDAYIDSLVASSVDAFIPYIPRADYADMGSQKVITVTEPLSDTNRYVAEVQGQASTTYHVLIETLQDGVVNASQVFTQTTDAGISHGVPITVSVPGGVIQFDAASPAPEPTLALPDFVTLSGFAGTAVQATFAITETGGQQSLDGAVITATDAFGQLGGSISGSTLVITPAGFTVAASGSRTIDVQLAIPFVQPGSYLGSLIIASQNGGTHSVPLDQEVQPHDLFLPLITQN